MTTDNFCFYLQNRLIQTSQTGGQWYDDTSPFSIPCLNLHNPPWATLSNFVRFSISRKIEVTVTNNRGFFSLQTRPLLKKPWKSFFYAKIIKIVSMNIYQEIATIDIIQGILFILMLLLKWELRLSQKRLFNWLSNTRSNCLIVETEKGGKDKTVERQRERERGRECEHW